MTQDDASAAPGARSGVMNWTFTIPGRPMTWQRPGVYQGARLTQKKQREAKKFIALQALAQRPRYRWRRDLVYAVQVVGFWPDRRFGDADRLMSLVLDALEGVAYKADRQVRAQGSAMLLDKSSPRTEVSVVAYDEGALVPELRVRLRPVDSSG